MRGVCLIGGVLLSSACASSEVRPSGAAARTSCEGRRFSSDTTLDAEAARMGLPRCLGDGRWRFEVGDDRSWWLAYETEGGERRVAGEGALGAIHALGVDVLSTWRVLDLGGTSGPAIAFDVEAPDNGLLRLVAVWNGEEALLLDRTFGVMPRCVDGVCQASGTLAADLPCDWMRPPDEALTFVLTEDGYTLNHPVARAANLAQCPASSPSFVAFTDGAFDAAASARALRCAIARGEPAERLAEQLDAVCDEGPGGGDSCVPPAPGPRTCSAYWGLSGWIEAVKPADGSEP